MMGMLAVSGFFFNAVDQFPARHLWHLHVGDDQVRLHTFKNLQGLHAVGGGLHRKAALFQKAANGVADEHRIVDHQRYGRHEFVTCGMHAPGPETSSVCVRRTRRKRANVVTIVTALGGLRFLGFALDAFFDAHVLQFAGLEDFAALEAFHELGVFVAADDLHAWVFAGLFFVSLRLRRTALRS